MVPSVNPITGWEMVVYDSVVVESRIVGNKAESAGELVGMGVDNVLEESFLNNDPIVVEDIDEDEPILRLKMNVQTVPQTTTNPTIKHQRKTTTSPNIPITTPLP